MLTKHSTTRHSSCQPLSPRGYVVQHGRLSGSELQATLRANLAYQSRKVCHLRSPAHVITLLSPESMTVEQIRSQSSGWAFDSDWFLAAPLREGVSFGGSCSAPPTIVHYLISQFIPFRLMYFTYVFKLVAGPETRHTQQPQ